MYVRFYLKGQFLKLNHQRWAAQFVYEVRNPQFHNFVFLVRKAQLRKFFKFASALMQTMQQAKLYQKGETLRTIHCVLPTLYYLA